jgi:hypothetical protein
MHFRQCCDWDGRLVGACAGRQAPARLHPLRWMTITLSANLRSFVMLTAMVLGGPINSVEPPFRCIPVRCWCQT